MDSVIQQGRDPEWRLAFEDRLDEAARARVRSAVKNGESVDEPNQASIAAGLARREQRRVLLLGLVLLPVQLGVAVFWVRLFVTGRLPAVFGGSGLLCCLCSSAWCHSCSADAIRSPAAPPQ
jgi:hypothetical protein